MAKARELVDGLFRERAPGARERRRAFDLVEQRPDERDLATYAREIQISRDEAMIR